MEQSRVTDEEKIHNSTLQLLQTVTSRLGKSDADQKSILSGTPKCRFWRSLPVAFLFENSL